MESVDETQLRGCARELNVPRRLSRILVSTEHFKMYFKRR